ncbi:hypothetical protein DL93DRAFT_2089759 [Clavulina sp. PMI_390]|nr:hypothetical protein DL93DRAFT_2089759 [Clavulina sp. PMI_390]
MLSQEVDLTPALLAPTSEMRAARVTGLTQTVAEIETLISHLSPNSDKSISQLKLLRARIIFSLSPISAVVEEILLRIFDWVIHMKQARRHSMWRWSLDLSHTCSQWRSITIGRSRLWSRLTVSYPKQNPLISLFCVRSRLVRCNLRISSYPPGGPIQIPGSSIEIQPSSAPQISEITFRDRGAFDALRLDDLAMSLLSLNHVCAIDVLFTQSNFPSYILRVPSLELVSCSFDAELLSEITFNLLHHLTLGAQMDGKGALLLVAAHMPVLDHMIINGVSVDDEIALPTKIFNSLRRLELKDTQSDFHQLIGSALLFPNLNYLSIQKLFIYQDWEFLDQEFPNMVGVFVYL